MAFSVNLITLAGQRFIAQATAANPIILTRGGGTPTFSEAPVTTLARQAQILSASADGTTARIVIRFFNTGQSGMTLKSFGVYAKLRDGITDELMLYAADPDAAIYIPSETEPAAFVDVAFSVQIQTADIIQAVDAAAAAPGDLLRLVSKHKAGNPDEGEPLETIRGEKLFIDTVKLGANVLTNARLEVNGAAVFQGASFERPVYAYSGLFAYSLGADYELTVGKKEEPGAADVYGRLSVSGDIYADTLHAYNALMGDSGRVEFSAEAMTPEASYLEPQGFRFSQTSGARTDAVTFDESEGGEYTLQVLQSTSLDGRPIVARTRIAGGAIDFGQPGDSRVELGASTGLRIRSVSDSEYKWGIDMNGHVRGIIPLLTADNWTDPPVGALIPLYVENVTSNPSKYRMGEQITEPNLGTYSASGGVVKGPVVSGTYRIIIGLQGAGSGTGKAVGLAIREY